MQRVAPQGRASPNPAAVATSRSLAESWSGLAWNGEPRYRAGPCHGHRQPQQLRSRHDRAGRGPADHSLLQPDPPYWGFRNLTKEEAKDVDAERLRRLRDGDGEPLTEAA